MKKAFITLLLLLPLALYAQNLEQNVDSLRRLLEKADEDTNKVKLFIELSLSYHTVDPIEGIKYGRQGMDLAEVVKWRSGVARANSAIGLNYQYKSDYPQAIEYYFVALKIFEETGEKRRLADLMRNIASVYQYQKDYDKVLEYNFKSLKIYEDMNDKGGIATTLSNIGIFYFSLHNYDKALEFDYKAVKINEELGNKGGTAAGLGNIGNTYMYLKEYSKSQACNFQSLRIFEAMGDKYGIAIDLGNIGETYLTIAKDASGKVHPDSLIPGSASANLQKAIEYLDKSIIASKAIDQLDNIIEFSQFLSEAYELQGNFRAALESYKIYTRTNDSVYNASNSLKIKQEEHIHQLELKDKDIQIAKLEVAKRHSERIFYIGGILLLLATIGIVLKNFYTQKKTNRALTAEKKRSDDLLLNILPEEVANELKATGGSTVKHFENVTVLFTDFVNFTEAGERMRPEELINELHVCFKAFDEIIDKYNIEKIKTIGDAYLAVSGLPVEDPLHAVHIVTAAREIQAFMHHRKQQIGNRTFEVRVGIHSGSVVAGIVGVKKFAYDIWGDTVNTAARLQENSEAGKINISQTTYELVKDQFVCTYRGEIAAKNKGGLKMYFVG